MKVAIADTELIRAGITVALTKFGDADLVGAFDRCSELLEALPQLLPDLCIIDPKEEVACLGMIKQSCPTTKILIFTAACSGQTAKAYFGEGVDGIVLKSAPLEHLELAVRSVYGGAGWVDPSIAAIIRESARGSTSGYRLEAIAEADFPELTERERDVLCEIADGKSNVEIATALSISHDTVKSHIRKIMHKFAIHSRTGLAAKVIRLRELHSGDPR